MKPAVWRIFRNNRWTYSDTPSMRSDERAAWQPLYAVPKKEWVELTADEQLELAREYRDTPVALVFETGLKLKEKNNA